MSRSIDVDRIPAPLLAISRGGAVTTNLAFRRRLGELTSTRQLGERFDVALRTGHVLDADSLPWERALRQSFQEEQTWFDRLTGSRQHHYVHATSDGDGGVLVLDDVTLHAKRVVKLACAVAHAACASTVATAADTIARLVASAIGAHAVFVFAPAGGDGLRPLACNRRELRFGVFDAAIAAARTRSHRDIAAIASPKVLCDATRALLADGLRSLAAFPLAAGGASPGAIVIAWRYEGAASSDELQLLHGISSACACALEHARQRSESALLDELRAATLAVGDSTSVHEVLGRLAEQACRLVGARCATLGIAGERGESISDLAIVSAANGASFPPSESDARALLEAVMFDGDPQPSSPRTQLEPRALSRCLGARLSHGGRLLGGLCLFETPGRRFTDAEEHAVALFAPHAAAVIDRCAQLERAREDHRLCAARYDELSAGVAHEMRTPMASSLLHVEILLRGRDDEAQVSVPVATLVHLREGLRRISRMVADLFDASRVVLQRFTLELRRLSLKAAVTDLLSRLEPTLDDRAVVVEASQELPAVLADPLRLDEIITNLIDNAMKHSEPTSPVVIRLEPDLRGVVLTVQDRGAGIPDDEIPKLFDRFYQAKQPKNRATGLGLGLYITKGLVEAHGGRIWVESHAGVGTSFHVWLPSEEAHAVAAHTTVG